MFRSQGQIQPYPPGKFTANFSAKKFGLSSEKNSGIRMTKNFSKS